MYSRSQLASKYVRYRLKAANSKGHGIHSPFVFDFVTQVLNDKRKYYCYQTIEKVRSQLKQNKNIILIDDYGAGSDIANQKKRKISVIARTALKPKKFSQLLFRMVNYFKPTNILELGTSLGITTAYLASANINTPVITMEGAENILRIAKNNFNHLNLSNIKTVQGNFDSTLPLEINQLSTIDFVFIDGNHRKEPTLRYFKEISKKITENSVIVFDDIHWSKEMEEAWYQIKTHSSVTLTVDLFFIGIVFFRKQQKTKQHFIIRF